MSFRWAIVAPGGIANKFAETLAKMDDTELHAVVSRDMGRAQAFCDKHGGKRAYDKIEDMLADDKVDGVYVASPHRFHHAQSLACLRAGKPVLCEKPLVVKARDAEELIAAASEHKVFLMEAMWARFLPIFEVVREWIDAGRIGELGYVHCTFGIPLVHRVDASNRMVNPDLAGGAILDMGIYPIAVTQHLYGSDPIAIKAYGNVTDKGVDLFTGATLDYGDGRSAQFMCTMLTTARNELYIHGRDGYIHVHPTFFASTKATFHTWFEEHTVEKPFRINGFEYQIEESIKCIKDGLIESPRMTHAQSLASAKVIDAIREQIGARYDFE